MLLEKEKDTNTQSGTVFMPAEFLDAVGSSRLLSTHPLYPPPPPAQPSLGGDSSVGRVSDWKAGCNTDVGLSPQHNKIF